MAAYAWLRCEREEDKDCYRALKKAGIIGREGTLFGTASSYVRLSLIKTQDDFDIMLNHLNKLVTKEKQNVKNGINHISSSYINLWRIWGIIYYV